MFINRADKRQVTANTAPIKMYVYVNELDGSQIGRNYNHNDDIDSVDEDVLDYTTAEEDSDQVSDTLAF